MSITKIVWPGFRAILVLALTMSAGWITQEGRAQTKKAKVELPAAVAKAIKDNRPNASIDKLEVEKEAGINLYDIEFKAGQGEIEVAEDGTVMDIATIVKMKDLPKAALAAIRKGAAGAKITQLEKSEVRAEIKEGKINKLGAPKYVYEAELAKGNQRAEIQVTPDGEVIEAPKWKTRAAKEKDETDKL